jgi:chromosome segregation ATPase
MTTISDLRTNIAALVPNLQQWQAHISDIESMDAECASAEAKLAAVKKDLAGWKSDVKEATGQYNDIVKKANEKLAKLEVLDREIKAKSKKLAEINVALSKFPERALESFNAELVGRVGELSQLITKIIATLRQQQGG